MSFRTRIAATAAGAVAIAVLLVSVAAYAASSRSLRGEVDRDLAEAAGELIDRPEQVVFGIIQQIEDSLPTDARFDGMRGRGDRSLFGTLPAGRFGGASGFAQVVDSSGALVSIGGDLEVPANSDSLPVTDQVLATAAGKVTSYYETVDVDGASVRIYTQQFVPRPCSPGCPSAG